MKKQVLRKVGLASICAVTIASTFCAPSFAAVQYGIYPSQGIVKSDCAHSDFGMEIKNGSARRDPYTDNNGQQKVIVSFDLNYCNDWGLTVSDTDPNDRPLLKIYENSTNKPLSNFAQLDNIDSYEVSGSYPDITVLLTSVYDIADGMTNDFHHDTYHYEIRNLKPETEYIIKPALGTTSSSSPSNQTVYAVAITIEKVGVTQATIDKYTKRSDTSVAFDHKFTGNNTYDEIVAEFWKYGDDENAVAISPKEIDYANGTSTFEFSNLEQDTDYILYLKYKKSGRTLDESELGFWTLGKAPKVELNDKIMTIIDKNGEEGTSISQVDGSIRKNVDGSTEKEFRIDGDNIKNGTDILLDLSKINIELEPNTEYIINAHVIHENSDQSAGTDEEIEIVFATDANGKPSRVISVNGNAVSTPETAKSAKNPSTLDPIVTSIAILAIAGTAAAAFAKFGKLSRR